MRTVQKFTFNYTKQRTKMATNCKFRKPAKITPETSG